MPTHRMKSTGSLIDASPETIRAMRAELEPVDSPAPAKRRSKRAEADDDDGDHHTR